MHTKYSDGKSDLHEYVHEAAKKKIDEIGFSDHIYIKKETWSMDFSDLPRYVSNITQLKTSDQLSIKMGLEVDFVPDRMDELMNMIGQYDFDYLLGSVHYIGSWLIDSEREIEEWKSRNVAQVYEQYFDLVQSMARTRLFDIVGHMDLVKKFHFRPNRDLNDVLLEAVQTISKSGMCVEVNTGGLRKPCHEVYPSEKLLEMCFDNGLPITMGSDAHSPEDVGADFNKAIELLRRVGYDKITRFAGRNRDFVEL